MPKEMGKSSKEKAALTEKAEVDEAMEELELEVRDATPPAEIPVRTVGTEPVENESATPAASTGAGSAEQPAATASASETNTDDVEGVREGDRPSSANGEGDTDAEGLLQGPTVLDADGDREVTLDYDMLRETPFIDDYYNETYFYLVPRDPKSILAIWEISQVTRDQLREQYGQDFFDKNRLVMRVYQVTDIDFDGFNAHSVFEVDDWLNDKLKYWLDVAPDNDYVAELGFRAEGTSFFELVARSNTVRAPKGYPTDVERYNDHASVEVDPNNVELPVPGEEWRINQYQYWKQRTHAAPEEKGYWALVLHQHLPFVRHPEYDVPLEEQWFCEAVVSVYTQFLNMLWRLEGDKVDFRLTVSLTPSLLSMMQDPLLKTRVARHIDECIALATRERDNSHGAPYHDTVEQILHRFWIAKQVFDAYEGDLTRGYRDFQDMGKLEVITCPATHMVLPLFKHFPEAVRGQIQIACRQYNRVFGRWPRGIWLPENAYTPGIDAFLAAEGIKWFLVNSNGIKEGDTKAHFGTQEPVVTPHGVACFGIDEMTRAQVWSREAGYPGHENYKEWYRDLGYEAEWDYLPPYFKTANVRRNTGLKYYRITGKKQELGDKDYYNPLWAEGTVHEQAGQFVYHRGAQANHALNATGHKSCIVSAYDAELFGHWWEEGPDWLESVFRKMCCDQQEVRPVTPSEYLGEHPTHQKMTPGASSWGKKDYFQTWVDDREYQPNCWVFRHVYRLSNKMIDLATRFADLVPGEDAPAPDAATNIKIRALNQAAREYCLAVASDWGFLIETGQAVRYSEIQIISHVDRAKELIRQIEADEINLDYLATLESADTIFPYRDMDYRVFCRG